MVSAFRVGDLRPDQWCKFGVSTATCDDAMPGCHDIDVGGAHLRGEQKRYKNYYCYKVVRLSFVESLLVKHMNYTTQYIQPKK